VIRRDVPRWRSLWPLPAAALLLLVALWNPTAPRTQQRWMHLVFVDITQSMNTLDMPAQGATAVPAGGAGDSRLAFTRRALQRTLTELPCGSQLGLGVFTEYRSVLLLAPLEVCANYEELFAVIERIDGRLAWAGASEIWRGVESALQVTSLVEGAPTVVFISDGHEAPPLRGSQQIRLELPPRAPPGWIAGVGGDVPMPIPKFDPTGRALGVWQADEVLQSDPASLGRTVGGARQTLVDADGAPIEVLAGSGIEHLSSLREPHLRMLAEGAGLQYLRLRQPGDLAAALRAPSLARPVTSDASWRWLPALLALALMLWPLLRRS
jgi:mxaL protein